MAATTTSYFVEFLRLALPLVLALGLAAYFDRQLDRRGLLPPGFRSSPRRAAGFAIVASVLLLGVFLTAAHADRAGEIDTSQLTTPQLFVLHLLLLASLGAWFVLGYVVPRPIVVAREPEDTLGPAPIPPPRASYLRIFADQFGLRPRGVAREVAIGVGVGVVSWIGVLGVVAAIALSMAALGGGKFLPTEPSSVIPWMAALPIAVRVLLATSAGVVEELFFRGFLQPRIGIFLSTACFALAHLSYGQPFLLVGVTLLSLVYSALVTWRQSLWAAIVAHALFDGIQLLVVIPIALRYVQNSGAAGS